MKRLSVRMLLGILIGLVIFFGSGGWHRIFPNQDSGSNTGSSCQYEAAAGAIVCR